MRRARLTYKRAYHHAVNRGYDGNKIFKKRSDKDSLERKHINDKYFDPLEKIYMEFERKHNLKVEKIDVTSIKGKRLRSEILFNLKERGGLKYTEIIKLDLFSV